MLMGIFIARQLIANYWRKHTRSASYDANKVGLWSSYAIFGGSGIRNYDSPGQFAPSQ